MGVHHVEGGAQLRAPDDELDGSARENRKAPQIVRIVLGLVAIDPCSVE